MQKIKWKTVKDALKKEVFYLSSPVGLLEVCLQGKRLYSLSKAYQGAGAAAANGRKTAKKKRVIYKNIKGNVKFFSKTAGALSPFGRSVQRQLEAYFAGKRREFSIPLSPLRGTEFQKKAWEALRAIPWGQTETYGALARQVGCPKGARALGSACAKNPFLIVVPCHRALAAKGLGGFAMGLKAKKVLLSIEGSSFTARSERE